MRYLPKSPAERQEMLAAIGRKIHRGIVFQHSGAFSPARAAEDSRPFSEAEVIRYFQERAAENSNGYTSFLGAGVYNHFALRVTDAVIQRGEFLTSYTPYQAEITQGTLQAIFGISDADVPAHRSGSCECLHCTTAQRRRRKPLLMAERLTGGDAVLGGAVRTSGIPRRAEDLREKFRIARGRNSVHRNGHGRRKGAASSAERRRCGQWSCNRRIFSE